MALVGWVGVAWGKEAQNPDSSKDVYLRTGPGVHPGLRPPAASDPEAVVGGAGKVRGGGSKALKRCARGRWLGLGAFPDSV